MLTAPDALYAKKIKHWAFYLHCVVRKCFFHEQREPCSALDKRVLSEAETPAPPAKTIAVPDPYA
jgi:hypothetical protein